MGGGQAQRRRAKNAAKANVSLHKAALGKAGASAHVPLPSAPTKEDYKDRMPASLRKMLALKEAAEQPAKRRKLDGVSAVSIPQAHPGTHKGSGKHEPQGEMVQQPQQPDQQQAPHSAQQTPGVWQESKRLKQRKKEYLKAKQMKKKGGKHKKAAAEDMDALQDRPAFGEVVHAPPDVALKSKHWAGHTQQQQQQVPGHSTRTAGSSQKHKQQQKQKKQRPPKRQNAQDEELQQMREAVIETYRTGRPEPQEGRATLKSLKALVNKSALMAS